MTGVQTCALPIYDTATTEIYTSVNTLSLHDALPISVAGAGKFRDLLAGDKDVTARLDAAEIDRAFNLEHHLRHASEIIDRALAEESP